ncbi:MAG: aminotransferase class III-fold pyridoxal phosphate-dependent enzyme [Stutzerimonas stutzeri]
MGYHGVGFGGMSVGGLVNNRRVFGRDATRRRPPAHTLDLAAQRLQQGPAGAWRRAAPMIWSGWSRCMARRTIAAVIVEPMSGSAGVMLPPKGYLQRLREITDKHGILLIFDEVITGFGRLGDAFAAQHFGVTPDIVTMCQGPDQRRDPDGRGVRQPQGV